MWAFPIYKYYDLISTITLYNIQNLFMPQKLIFNFCNNQERFANKRQ